MDSLHKAVRMLSKLKTLKAQEKDRFEDSNIKDLLGEKNNEESLPSEDEIQPQITNDPSDWAAFEKTIDQQEGRSIMEASLNIKLFKMANKLNKISEQNPLFLKREDEKTRVDRLSDESGLPLEEFPPESNEDNPIDQFIGMQDPDYGKMPEGVKSVESFSLGQKAYKEYGDENADPSDIIKEYLPTANISDIFDFACGWYEASDPTPKRTASQILMNTKLAAGPMDDDYDDYDNKYYGSPNIDTEEIYDSIEKAVAPDNIDLFEGPVEEGDIPEEYSMQQLSDEDIDQIYGIEGTEDDPTPFTDDPITGKRHYDVISDTGLPTNDEEEEEFTESPTEVEDFFQQIERELAELNAEEEEGKDGFDEFASELKKFKKLASK